MERGGSFKSLSASLWSIFRACSGIADGTDKRSVYHFFAERMLSQTIEWSLPKADVRSHRERGGPGGGAASGNMATHIAREGGNAPLAQRPAGKERLGHVE
jgi:hypothetical protein